MIGKGRLSELYTIYVKRERDLNYVTSVAAAQKVRCVELMYRGWDDGNDDQLESALTVGERNR